jgi:hypothetical protein
VTISVSGNSPTSVVTVVGRAPTATLAGTLAIDQPSLMTVTVEQQDPRITDDALAWSQATGTDVVQLTAARSGDEITWTGEVLNFSGVETTFALRLTFQEYERFGSDPTDQRLVFTETLPWSAPSLD